MNVQIEREEFADRLRQALQMAGYRGTSPTELLRLYNVWNPAEPLSVHAVRKWLMGESIPTQAKLRVLAQGLRVASHWLRYGDGEVPMRQAAESALTCFDAKLLTLVHQLKKENQQMVLDMVQALARKEEYRE